MSKKGQWFIVSAVIASATFVTISLLYSGYFSLDSSKIFAQDEGAFFNNVIYELNNTLGYSSSDVIFSENFKDFKTRMEQVALERGYFLSISNTTPLRITGTDISMSLLSSTMNISKSFRVPLNLIPTTTIVSTTTTSTTTSVSTTTISTTTSTISAGPLGYWRFGEGSGNFTTDSSGNDNGGYLKGSALKFDSINDYLAVPSSNSLNLLNTFTITGWIRPSKQFNYLSDYYEGIIDKGSYQIFMDKSDGKMKFYLASNNPASWSTFGSGMDDLIESLIVWNGSLYAGGLFNTASGNTVNHYAKWNGSAWSALGSGLNDVVYTSAVWNGSLFVGGSFTTAGGNPANHVAKWNGSAWSALGSGLNSEAHSLTIWNGSLYAGGSFTTAGGVAARRVARWDGNSWYPLGSGMDNGLIKPLMFWNGSLYAAGTFTSIGGIPFNRTARWNGTTWSPLGSGLTGGDILAATVWNGSLYIGGDIVTAGGLAVNNVAKWDGSSWSALGSGTNNYLESFSVWNGSLYASGTFTTAGGNPANRIAKWSGSAWSALGSGTNDVVHSSTIWKGSLYAGGTFTTAGGNPANRIAKWSSGEAFIDSSKNMWPVDWSHFALTYNGTNLIFYVNGIPENSIITAVGNIPSNNIPLFIGQSYGSRESDGGSSSSPEIFNGALDEIRIYNRTLSAAEISQNYMGSYYDETGLMIYIPFADRSGTRATDYSGKGNNGTLFNYANTSAGAGDVSNSGWMTYGNHFWTNSGKSGNAVRLNGADDYINIPISSTNSVDNFRKGFAVTAWLSGTYNGSERVIIAKNHPFFLLANGSELKAGVFTSTWMWVNASSVLQNNTWQHVAFTWDNQTHNLSLYLNGAPINSSSGLGDIVSAINNNISIGADSVFSRWYFNGTIDEVMIWNRTLSESEINVIYNS